MKSYTKSFISFSLFLILLISTISSTKAQEYMPIAVEGTHWIVALNKIETEYPVDGLWEYYANGDTVVDSQEYKKIYYRNLVITQDGPPYEAASPYHLTHLLRDDIDARKAFVYAIDFNIGECDINEEVLLYDFSLSEGDIVDFCLFPDWIDGSIGSINNIQFLGKNTSSFEIDCGSEVIYYEGIGSNYGLFEFMFTPYKKDAKYTEYTFLTDYCVSDDCELFLGNNDIANNSQQVSCYPNPSDGYFSFDQLNRYIGSSIFIYDVFGRFVDEIKIHNQKVVWNSKNIESGIYFYKIADGNTQITGQLSIK